MFNFIRDIFVSKTSSRKVLDTSILIDGRILDLVETGFLDGEILVPQFVLIELQQVADSNDDTKRKRGRRGLDILERLQSLNIVKILDKVSKDVYDTIAVDMKLVKLCQNINAKLVTVDFNLNKVAKIHGVKVLNVNDLNNALKPHIDMGEIFWIRVVKRGNQKGQGVGYLDDGTMVIIDQAETHINEKIKVVARSINQTQTARIIFTKPYKEDNNEPV